MYYNKILKECFNFMVKNGYAPTVIYMSNDYYDNLEREMVGAQWKFLVKCSLVLGMKVIIDFSEKEFRLE